MSETESTPLSQPEKPVQLSASSAPLRKPTRRMRKLLWSGLIAAILVVVGLAVTYTWISSSAFEEIVRKRLIINIENTSGGRVEIAAFHWHPLDLEMEVDGLKIHGLEAATEQPYAQIEHLRVRLSVFILWSPRILLRDLTIDQPNLHLIVYPDGSTNQPKPKKTRKPGKSGLETLFNLQTGPLPSKTVPPRLTS